LKLAIRSSLSRTIESAKAVGQHANVNAGIGGVLATLIGSVLALCERGAGREVAGSDVASVGVGRDLASVSNGRSLAIAGTSDAVAATPLPAPSFGSVQEQARSRYQSGHQYFSLGTQETVPFASPRRAGTAAPMLGKPQLPGKQHRKAGLAALSTVECISDTEDHFIHP
jgi:hypothetical protein